MSAVKYRSSTRGQNCLGYSSPSAFREGVLNGVQRHGVLVLHHLSFLRVGSCGVGDGERAVVIHCLL